MRVADTPLDAELDVILFHDRMLAKGDVFYGVAVEPPKGKEGEVKARLEQILRAHGCVPKVITIDGHVVFEGEYPAEAMEEVRQYLTSIEDQTPSPPVMKVGDYFQMIAYKWLKGIATTYRFGQSRG